MGKFEILSLLFLFFCGIVFSNRVLELSDRFLEIRNNGVWLVMFYAPWCGHCKNLDPVWNQVAQSLVDTDIRVGRLDCTRFTSVATEFSVSGFPTILFIKGHKTVEYRGDRERFEIVEFARRMDGPAIRHFANCDQFHVLRKDRKVFFAYINGPTIDEDDELKDTYTRIAEEFQTIISFYTAPAQCIATIEGLAVPKVSSVYVCKDRSCFPYEEDLLITSNMTLRDWVNKERFPTFVKVTHGNFHQLLKSQKNIAIAVLEENQIGGLTLHMSEFRDVLEAIAVNNKNLYHENFIFGWLGQPDLANNIAMTTLSIPSLIVVNTTSYQYYLPVLEDEKIPSPQTILQLLDQVKNHSAEALGGDTFFYKVYRNYYNMRTSLAGMWKGNPVLTTVLLGLPFGLFSIICYTTCCTDILEAGEEDEEQETSDERHQKKE